jgi:(R,R)-butanediol dehydrogenase/meso-butanediol dehydrogenase/diacetyl reductase
MRAAVYQGEGRISVEERPLPELGPRDVLVEVSHCGVCGTDLHMVLEGMGRPNSIGGHEYSGRIAALGAQVEGWSEGEAVVGGSLPGCGRCRPCREARPSLCSRRADLATGEFQGAFAEYTRVPEAALVRVPPGLSLRAAALAEPLAVALHAITRAGIEAGERALVTGTGPIGLLVVAALRARGVEEVVASEPAPERRARAERVGAAVAVAPDELVTPPMPFTAVEEPFDAVFECSGNPRAMQSGLAQLRAAGTLVLVGTGMRRPKLDHNRILLNELVVTGAYNYDAGGFDAALALLGSGRMPLEHLIEPDDVPLEALRDAMDRLAAGTLAAKVMAVPKEAS